MTHEEKTKERLLHLTHMPIRYFLCEARRVFSPAGDVSCSRAEGRGASRERRRIRGRTAAIGATAAQEGG